MTVKCQNLVMLVFRKCVVSNMYHYFSYTRERVGNFLGVEITVTKFALNLNALTLKEAACGTDNNIRFDRAEYVFI